MAQSVHPIVLKASAKKKACAMSHEIESPKAENVAANVGGECQRLGEHGGAKVEQGDGVERNREWETERQTEV